jgi:adenylosuccinate lyase
LTRGKVSITKVDIQNFIEELQVEDVIKEELRMITPHNYIGVTPAF